MLKTLSLLNGFLNQTTKHMTEHIAKSFVSLLLPCVLLVATANSHAEEKILYFDNLADGFTGDLVQVEPLIDTRSAILRIDPNDANNNDFVEVNQTPATQDPFIINAGNTIDVDINFFVRSPSLRTVKIELIKVNAGGTETMIGDDSQQFDVDYPVEDPDPLFFQYVPFQVTPTSNITFDTNDFVRLIITNTTMLQGDNITRDRIRVHSRPIDRASQIKMQTTPENNIQISKTSKVISDPVNLISNPKAIPGSIVEYTISVDNAGFGSTDNDTIVITDPIPANTTLSIDPANDPVSFIDGIIPSGLSFNFSNDVTISSTQITINPKGTFNGSNGTDTPSFKIKFKVKID